MFNNIADRISLRIHGRPARHAISWTNAVRTSMYLLSSR